MSSILIEAPYPPDARTAVEAELLDALHCAEAEYKQASFENRGAAKSRYLAALREFNDFVTRGRQ